MADGKAIWTVFKLPAVLEFDYVNWKGLEEKRLVAASMLAFGSNEFHPEPCLMIQGICLNSRVLRSFDTSKITNLKVVA